MGRIRVLAHKWGAAAPHPSLGIVNTKGGGPSKPLGWDDRNARRGHASRRDRLDRGGHPDRGRFTLASTATHTGVIWSK